MSQALSQALADTCSGYLALKPPNHMRVSAGAAAALKIARPGDAPMDFSLTDTPYMVEPMDVLASRLHSAVCFAGPAQTGKALDVSTPLPTPTGWTTMGAVAVGDEVLDEQGRPTRVVFATEFQHGRQCYAVDFSDGSTIVADADHRWGVERFYWVGETWRSEVLTTSEMLPDFRLGAKRFRYRIPVAGALQTPAAALAIDPYVLGVWLGDGAARQATISAHVDDAQHYVNALAAAGHTADVRPDKGKTVCVVVDRRAPLSRFCQRWHDMDQMGRTPAGWCRACERLKYRRKRHGESGGELGMFANTFTSRLRDLKVVGNKHIPVAYLRASESQRWALLRGLMDTDGTCSRRAASAEFTTVLPALRDGVLELLCSLGLKPSVAEKRTTWTYKSEKKVGTAYRVTFPIPPGVLLFSLTRKVEVQQTAKIEVGHRMIVGIRPVESRPVKCIQVANDSHLYLAGERMIPTHNTLSLGEGWFTHAATNDPGDMLIVQMTQDKAREYSKQRIDRAITESPKLQELMGRAQDDNTHDKLLRNGMWLRIAWPTATNLSSTSYRYVFGTDYDRWKDNIDGEGDGFTLMGKRVTTYLSRGMVAVESSPGRELRDPKWQPASAHEAPPVGGILGIYNRGDRRRWYWKCPHCACWMQPEPGLGLFRLPGDDELLQGIRTLDIDAMARQYARVICPNTGCIVGFDHRYDMNLGGIWLPDGVRIDDRDQLEGTPRVSSIASFWLGGMAAAFQRWEDLIRKHLQALLQYAMTGEELPLQTTMNTDQGRPYMPRHLTEQQEQRAPSERVDKTMERYVVPDWTRFVLTTVDVQGGKRARFEVQVHAHGADGQQAVIDRHAITRSKRPGMGDEFAPLDPASHPEDWDVLNDVVTATYRTSNEGLEIRTHCVGVDTGGEDGVTTNAYKWFRRLRLLGLNNRVRLLKGHNQRVDWHVRETMVGGKQGKGDIPLHLVSPHLVKDQLSNLLERQVVGPGYIHFPSWLPAAFFDELGAEVRDAKNNWVQVRPANESFDLAHYQLALCHILKVDKIRNWDMAPHWARPLFEGNTEVVTRGERLQLRETVKVRQAALPAAAVPAPAQAAPANRHVGRRTSRSGYLK